MVLSASILLGLIQGGRFQLQTPLAPLPPIYLDSLLNQYQGPTKQVCDKYGLQGRTLWIDATANIDRYNSDEKIIALVAQIKKSGFNTIVFDVKPLSSEMVYPSAYAPKLKEWKGKVLGDFDPLRPMSREAKKHNLQFFVAMNAFCDGHRLVNRGPGFERPDEQSVIYEATPTVVVSDSINPNLAEFEISSKFEEGKVVISNDFPATAYSLTCDRNGNVIQSSGAVPKGGFRVSGTGDITAELRKYDTGGMRISLASKTRFVRIGESNDKQYPLMTSPTNPSVRRRLFDLAKEVTTNYAIDGLIYDDRLRYTGINGDFSETTKSMFERHVGEQLQWPQDVFEFTFNVNNGTLTRGIRPGKFYDEWMAWRAGILRNFVRDVRATIRQINPRALMGVYAGSWYGEYQQYGNNWAAPAAEAGFWFLTPEYKKAGMANELDLLITGCYYPTATVYDAMVEGKGLGFTVEASANLSYRAAHDQTWVYGGIMLSDFKDNPAGLEKALQAAVHASNGVMVFDLSHDIDPMWPVFDKAFSKPKKAPTSGPFDLMEARRIRTNLERRGEKEPPIMILGGAAGVGF